MLNLIENFAESKSRLVNSRTVKRTSPKNSENLTTADTVCEKNILVDIGNIPSINLDLDSDKSNLVKQDNVWREKLESLEICWNELVSLVASFGESKSQSVDSRNVKRERHEVQQG